MSESKYPKYYQLLEASKESANKSNIKDDVSYQKKYILVIVEENRNDDSISFFIKDANNGWDIFDKGKLFDNDSYYIGKCFNTNKTLPYRHVTLFIQKPTSTYTLEGVHEVWDGNNDIDLISQGKIREIKSLEF